MLLNLLSAEWFLFRFDSPMNACRTIAIWLSAVLVIVFALIMLLTSGGTRKKCAKISLIVTIVYVAALSVLFLSLSFAEDGIKPILFYPLLALILVLGASGVCLYFRRDKAVFLAAGIATGAALIATLVCMMVHFSTGDPVTDNGIEDAGTVNTLALWLLAAMLLAAVVALAFLFGRKDKKGFDSRSIAFAAVCIAMSFALSYLRIVKLPQGGSITLASLLPLMLYSYMFGTKKGVFAGMIYGVLQAFQDTYILHPAQFLLDYPLAFSAIGLAGMFARTDSLRYPQVKFALGAVVAGVGRLAMHFVSGIFAFGEFAPEGQPVALYSFIYQASYVLPDIAIVIVVGALLLSSRTFRHEIERYTLAPAAGEPVAEDK